ncbi:translation initiation factor 2 [Streptomyces sp. NPDC059009]|uniref:translation initiation factor 2 n=1 Tax=Streptomyces sp. NPDC059009 TaxID=3346694 RepID=UPI00369C7FEC
MLFAVRSATALHRLLDVLPVFAGDERIRRRFTLVPGSEFGVDALAAIERAGAHVLPWAEACGRAHDLVLAASPKGELERLSGPRVLLPHGAGFNKAVPEGGSADGGAADGSSADGGSADSASGLDPALLLRSGRPLARLHALAHPSQLDRLAAECPDAAARATVTGDPTFDRVLESLPLRERYRAALRTDGRTLVVLTSTWGPESLLARRPGLPAALTAHFPLDSYQFALVLHPNEHNRTGEFDLAEQLAPALAAGLVVARPHEEWAAVLVAADAVVTDHGSAALYAAAARDVPVIAACDGGGEVIPGTPMAQLLSMAPVLEHADDLERALAAHRPAHARALAEPAFAERGRALPRLREELYHLLGLDPHPSSPVTARPLPDPAPSARTLTSRTAFAAFAAFAVRVDLDAPAPGRDGAPVPVRVRVERRPPGGDGPLHHLAAEHGAAGERQLHSAGLIYRRAASRPARGESWTVGAWTTQVLAAYPGPRTAAVVLDGSRCVLRETGGALLTLTVEPDRSDEGRVRRADPAAVLSAAHAWLRELEEGEDVHLLPIALTCALGGRTYAARLAVATEDEALLEFQ